MNRGGGLTELQGRARGASESVPDGAALDCLVSGREADVQWPTPGQAGSGCACRLLLTSVTVSVLRAAFYSALRDASLLPY